jgi:protein-S-isoprenylcysteine O-methyltransferase Ste14
MMARPASVGAARRDRIIGWAFVAVQALLLIALFLTPPGSLWPVTGAVGAVGTYLTVAGFGLVVWAVLTFGAGVTPSPVPSPRAALQTVGPFRWVRHPMYTGVMTIALGMTVGRASLTALVLLAVLVVFFNVKARWEEQRLVDRYAGYAEYRKGTGRFVPRFFTRDTQRSPI